MATDQVAPALELLQQAVARHPRHGRMRFELAQILAYNGQATEAIELAQQGITDEADRNTKLNLLIFVGGMSHQLATDGPSVLRRQGIVQYSPEDPSVDKAAFVEKYLAVAEAAFRDLLAAAPDDAQIMQSLAQTLTLAGKVDAAAELWEKRLEQDPANREATIQLASLRFELQQPDAGVKLLKDALEQSANDHEMLELLVKHYEKVNDAEATAYWKPRHEFGKRVPSFSTIEYSEENSAMLDSLSSAERVAALFDDKTPASSELLAVYCWMHPHNDLESKAFVELGDRGANELLRGLMNQGSSTCTIRGAAAQLARSKPADLLDRLLMILPGDRRAAEMDMDIANALAVLGDVRAVPALIAVLAPDDETEQDPSLMFMQDLDAARARAALALGAFDVQEATSALEAGLPNPRIGIACAGALYRISGDAEHLVIVEKAINNESYRAWFVLSRLVQKLPDDQEVKSLLARVEQRMEEQRKELEAKAE